MRISCIAKIGRSRPSRVLLTCCIFLRSMPERYSAVRNSFNMSGTGRLSPTKWSLNPFLSCVSYCAMDAKKTSAMW
ncbi:Uncharacterised protein [Vibrio cholerae]|nr:Uncharacterised protein [Vibrio cholerae]